MKSDTHTLTIADLMTPSPATLGPNDAEDQAREILEDGEIEHVPVVDQHDAVGLWMRDETSAPVLYDASHIGRARPMCDAS